MRLHLVGRSFVDDADLEGAGSGSRALTGGVDDV
jgi:hypothetical protein